MQQSAERRFFPALLGALHQEGAEGELILEQNDGTRRIFWEKGQLVYLQSDAAGEQFGNFLIRQGVLDRAALQELLSAKDDVRFGDRVVQWGLVTLAERDRHLHRLLEQVLLHALEHPVVNVVWDPGPIQEKLSSDLRFHLDHRPLIWEAFQQIRDLTSLVDLLYSEPDWRWEAREELLVSLSDLSLTPEMAYALSMLGRESLGFETFMSITGMEEDDAARLIVALWALGSLTLSQGALPSIPAGHAGRRAGKDPNAFSTGQMPIFATGTPASAPPPADPAPPRTDPPSPAPAPAAVPPPPPEILHIPLSWGAGPDVEPPGPSAAPGPVRGFQSQMPSHGTPPALPPQPRVFQPPLPSPPEASTWGVMPERPPVVHPVAPPEPPPEPVLADPFIERTIPESYAPQDHGQEGTPQERARALVKRAKVCLIQGKTVDAVRALEDAVRLDPESRGAFEAWLLLGKLRTSNPAWMNRAVEALQAATRINPLVAEPWALMGELYAKKGFKSNAVSCYRKALELDPSVPVPPDLDLGEPTPPASGTAGPEGKGLMGRLKGLFG